MTTQPQTTDPILLSLRLGWLAVESFGLLRRYTHYGKPPSPEKFDASRRFNFTERDPNLSKKLLISLQLLKATTAQLLPDLPPPIPADPNDLLVYVKADRQNINQIWDEFERWSQEVWNAMQIQSPIPGQAFACGGDLADTYWYAQGAGAEKLAETLRSYRLGYVTERVDDLADHLPEHVPLVIHNSLERWSIGEAVEGMDEDGQKRTLKRLESQIKVWHDLLFGLRQADSYLLAKDHRRITFGAIGATFLLVVLVGLAVWMVVLLLSSAGRALLAFNTGISTQATEASSDLVTQLLNWQNWSSLLAVVSSVLAVLTGVVKGLSGWLWAFYRNCYQALTMRQIKYRTHRSPSFRRKEKTVEGEASEG